MACSCQMTPFYTALMAPKGAHFLLKLQGLARTDLGALCRGNAATLLGTCSLRVCHHISKECSCNWKHTLLVVRTLGGTW